MGTLARRWLVGVGCSGPFPPSRPYPTAPGGLPVKHWASCPPPAPAGPPSAAPSTSCQVKPRTKGGTPPPAPPLLTPGSSSLPPWRPLAGPGRGGGGRVCARPSPLGRTCSDLLSRFPGFCRRCWPQRGKQLRGHSELSSRPLERVAAAGEWRGWAPEQKPWGTGRRVGARGLRDALPSWSAPDPALERLPGGSRWDLGRTGQLCLRTNGPVPGSRRGAACGPAAAAAAAGIICR